MKQAKEIDRDVPQPIELDSEASLAGLRILIVEDMGLIAFELQMVLERMGCTIGGIASRLSEAKEMAQTAEAVDGVLLDLNLSGESSYDVAKILHERGIPLIIMSGYDTSKIPADFASDAYLQKPFSHEDLASMQDDG